MLTLYWFFSNKKQSYFLLKSTIYYYKSATLRPLAITFQLTHLTYYGCMLACLLSCIYIKSYIDNWHFIKQEYGNWNMKWISFSNQDMIIIFKELLFYLIAIQPLGEPGKQNSCLSQVQCYIHLRHALYLKIHAWFSLCIRDELLPYILYWNMGREGEGNVFTVSLSISVSILGYFSVLPQSPYPLHPCLPLPPPPMSLALNVTNGKD